MTENPSTDPRDERREAYRYWLPMHSRWADCDAYGHVNNAIYYNWFDTVLTTMLIERGVLRDGPDGPIGLCVESQCKFLGPIHFPETIAVGLRIGRLGGKSARYELAFFAEDEDVPRAVGYFVHVFVEPVSRKPVDLGDARRARIADLVNVAG